MDAQSHVLPVQIINKFAYEKKQIRRWMRMEWGGSEEEVGWIVKAYTCQTFSVALPFFYVNLRMSAQP